MRLQHVSIPRPPGPKSANTARAFYSGLLGIPEKPTPASVQQLDLVWFQAGDGLELHVFAADSHDDPIERHFCLEVGQLAMIRQKLEAAAYEPYDPEEIPGQPRFFCRDPFNNLIEFTQIDGDYLEIEARG